MNLTRCRKCHRIYDKDIWDECPRCSRNNIFPWINFPNHYTRPPEYYPMFYAERIPYRPHPGEIQPRNIQIEIRRIN